MRYFFSLTIILLSTTNMFRLVEMIRLLSTMNQTPQHSESKFKSHQIFSSQFVSNKITFGGLRRDANKINYYALLGIRGSLSLAWLNMFVCWRYAIVRQYLPLNWTKIQELYSTSLFFCYAIAKCPNPNVLLFVIPTWIA